MSSPIRIFWPAFLVSVSMLPPWRRSGVVGDEAGGTTIARSRVGAIGRSSFFARMIDFFSRGDSVKGFDGFSRGR
jgi:hypothetical protein